MHSVNCIEGNTKSRAKFWGVIANSYNSTTDPHCQRTPKNLNNHWCACNKQVSLFNQIYNQEPSFRQSGANDVMVLETAKQWYKNWIRSEFKRLHWWEVVRHQPKWRPTSAGSSTTDPFLSSSDPAIEEEVTHPIGHDRAKAAARKGKEKEGSNSQSESSSIMSGIISTLKKLITSFTKM
jgi:hypothetical protein